MGIENLGWTISKSRLLKSHAPYSKRCLPHACVRESDPHAVPCFPCVSRQDNKCHPGLLRIRNHALGHLPCLKWPSPENLLGKKKAVEREMENEVFCLSTCHFLTHHISTPFSLSLSPSLSLISARTTQPIVPTKQQYQATATPLTLKLIPQLRFCCTQRQATTSLGSCPSPPPHSRSIAYS